jgi:hypothetical protein
MEAALEIVVVAFDDSAGGGKGKNEEHLTGNGIGQAGVGRMGEGRMFGRMCGSVGTIGKCLKGKVGKMEFGGIAGVFEGWHSGEGADFDEASVCSCQALLRFRVRM